MPFLKKHGRHHPCCGGVCLVARTGCLNMLPVSVTLIVGPSALWFSAGPALGAAAAGAALLSLSLCLCAVPRCLFLSACGFLLRSADCMISGGP